MLNSNERELTVAEREIFTIGLNAGVATERKRCVGRVLNLFAKMRRFPEFAEMLDDLATRLEHPELDTRDDD